MPEAFAAATVRREGPQGRRWVDDLPALIDDRLAAWRLQPDGPPLHGLLALVLPVRRDDGGPAALKVTWIDQETRYEHHALAWWAGRSAARLLSADAARGALLLERLDPVRTLERLPEVDAVTTAARVLHQLHVPPPHEDLPTTDALARRWIGDLPARWHDVGRPSALRVAAAVSSCQQLVASPGPPVLLHGDFHYANVLGRGHGDWAAIDPKPLVGDAEFDLVPLLRNRWTDIVGTGDIHRGVRERLSQLTHHLGLDPERARRWCHVRSVDDTLWGLRHHEHTFTTIASTIAAALSSCDDE